MGILDNLFGSSTAAAAPTTTDTPNPAPTEPPATTEAIQTIDAGGVTTQPETPAAGMDKFKGLWDTTPEDLNKAPTFPNFEVDPAKLMAEAGKVDFTQVVTPELLAEVTGGGEGAMQAMIKAMNLMSQATYAQSAAAATAITKSAYANAEASMETRIAKQINATDVKDGILNENPLLSHSAAQPIIAALNSQIATKFPNATSQERVAMAKQYLTEFATIANPATPDPVISSPEDQDWESFIS